MRLAEAYDAALRNAVEDVVRKQAEVGVDIVSDGEFGKGTHWAFYVHSRLTGITSRPLTPEEAVNPLATMTGGHDREAFPEYYEEQDRATGIFKRWRSGISPGQEIVDAVVSLIVTIRR